MVIAGYLAFALIGISLGLIGGGGSILTVPVLVYLLGVNPVLATAYSLFIVGVTSMVGALPKYREGLVDLKTAIIFGIPSILSVYAVRAWLVPQIPDPVFQTGSFVLTKALLLMGLFAVLMIFASVSMIRNKESTVSNVNTTRAEPRQFNYPMILLEGTLVGALTGLVGAGGGFLIIPALVLFSKLPMKMAVGTSLIIIAAKSTLGFIGDLKHYQLNWLLLSSATSLAIVGMFLGNYLNRRINGDMLKKGFGWFVLLMGVYILFKEFALHPPLPVVVHD